MSKPKISPELLSRNLEDLTLRELKEVFDFCNTQITEILKLLKDLNRVAAPFNQSSIFSSENEVYRERNPFSDIIQRQPAYSDSVRNPDSFPSYYKEGSGFKENIIPTPQEVGGVGSIDATIVRILDPAEQYLEE